jgi:hypothetical protein
MEKMPFRDAEAVMNVQPIMSETDVTTTDWRP